jgi:glycosyltransferase involved in cell wall biosynthesis/SAM-dependent methyltransferase
MPKKDIWGQVSKNYTVQIAIFEKDLAKDIAGILEHEEILAPSKLLEAGSGSGHLSIELAKLGYETTLLDFDKKAIEIAKETFKSNNILGSFIEGDIFRLSDIVKENYDVVWSSGVLEHMDFDSLVTVLVEMKKVSSKLVLIIVPNTSSFVYLAYRAKMIENQKWNFGVELLRSNYTAAIKQAGLKLKKIGYCGTEFTMNFLNYTFCDSASISLLEQIIKGRISPMTTHVLEYYLCQLEDNKDIEYFQISKDKKTENAQTEINILDRTYYLDALTSVQSILNEYKQRIEMLQKEREYLLNELKTDISAEQKVILELIIKGNLQLEKEMRDIKDEVGHNSFQIKELEKTYTQNKDELKACKDSSKKSLDIIEKLKEEKSEISSQKASLDYSLTEYQKRELETVNSIQSMQDSIGLLQTIFKSKTYRFARILRLFKNSIKSRNLVEAIELLKNTTAYTLTRKEGYFKKYLSTEDLYLVIGQLNKIYNQINRVLPANAVAGAQTSHFNTKPYVGELRRGRKQANPGAPQRVAYLTNQLLDWHDQRPRFGGGERYCLMLVDILESHGLKVDLYQIAPKSFQGEYYGRKVQALTQGECYSEFTLGAVREFYKISQEYDYVIYNLPELSAGPMRMDAINICHGIWFDHDNYGAAVKFRQTEWYQYLYRVFNNPKLTVSVDTNSINVIRSLWPELAKKMIYIPNFVDMNKFYPPEKPRDNDVIQILFPRRSQINRGSRILSDILKKIPHQVKFYWVGEGDDVDTKIIKDLCKQDTRLSYHYADFDSMPEWYRKSDICVIPTIACEGTSLSCLEALASGCATISTHVGGLSDLIQDEVNGLLVNPTAEAIAIAVNRLIENKGEREFLQQKGLDSAKAFSSHKWETRWVRLLSDLGWIEAKSDNKTPQILSYSIDTPRYVIVTRNAYHGGVETMLKLESEGLQTPIIVAGGLNNPMGTCPFKYEYVNTYESLLECLKKYDAVLYHWPLDWSVKAIHDSGLPSIEYVHRTDTSECDKTVPHLCLAHTNHIVDYVKQNYQVDAQLVPCPIDTERFHPDPAVESIAIGAITSYFDIKGIDIFLRAWAHLKDKYAEIPVVFYGAGDDLARYKKMAEKLGIQINFNGPLERTEEAYRQYRLYVSAARVEGGAPLAVLEALSTNIPVVASNIPGCEELNNLARSNGFEEPLILFESEDPYDLAMKIDQTLKIQDKRNLRTVVTSLFSAEAHILALKKVMGDLLKNVKKRDFKNWILLDECENTGYFATHEQDEGYIVAGTIDDEDFDAISELHINNTKYLMYRYKLPEFCDRISIEVDLDLQYPADIFIQIDWVGQEEICQKGYVVGRHVDLTNKFFYDTRYVPAELNPHFAIIVFRPNQGQSVHLIKMQVRAWKSN